MRLGSGKSYKKTTLNPVRNRSSNDHRLRAKCLRSKVAIKVINAKRVFLSLIRKNSQGQANNHAQILKVQANENMFLHDVQI